MEKRITRQIILSRDDLKRAIWYWLKHEMDQPMPEFPNQIEVTDSTDKIGVTFSEASILDVP